MDERDDTPPAPGERRIQDAVGALAPARPDAAFRARLRSEFTRGTIAPRLRLVRPAWRSRAFAWGSVAVAAAAAFVAVAFVLVRGPDWRVVGAEGPGQAIVDGRPVPLDHASELARALRRGGHVQVPVGATIDLVVPGVLAVTLSGGSDAVLPRIPGRYGERHLHGRVSAGDLFFSTGRAFHGATLDVETPEALAHVTGTSLAVLRDIEVGTCVCVMEGRVDVTARGEETLTIPAGSRIICPIDGGTEIAKILRRSEHALHRLHGKTGALLGR